MPDATCSVEGCNRRATARTWCTMHYARWRHHGTLDAKPYTQRASRPLAERFWEKVDKTGPNGCWLWTASRFYHGYGQFAGLRAHRWAWEQTNGPVPDGLELDHLCRIRHCVNPSHMQAVTHAENLRRIAR